VEHLERPAWGKHSSLLQTFVNYGRKRFYNIGLCFKKHLNRVSFREKMPDIIPVVALVLAYRKISMPLILSNHFGKPVSKQLSFLLSLI
jgi:hypothetical protein